MQPIPLTANQPADRFYAGGARIAAFRGPAGAPAAGDHVPEDWVGSVTPLFGETALGLTRLPEGPLLRDAVAADPVAWLGPAHVAAWGADVGVLVKLLDAGERLPVHAHPDVPFAAEHLGLAHGKTEAWIALTAAPVHLGFRRDVGTDELARWVAQQDTVAMLDAMHVLDLEPGDAVLVPAGTPHAIGAGALVVELQEPTDLSILVEWAGFAIDGAAAGHLGLGFATALAAVDRRGRSAAEVAALRGSRAGDTGDLLPDAAPFFRAERWRGAGEWDAGFAVAVVVAGSGALVAADGTRTPLSAGGTVLVPWSAGPLRLEATGSDLEVLRCRPPAGQQSQQGQQPDES
ncbi:class I mannose-6-phosphate isomerase [Cellulomonas triticagri]|uniref:Carbohydrate kinase n=1 Tax=Cellulomonas triticagri TaxID=2483352 RepID=A0A3M2JGY9_9CELL|nr:class I mannose-6-phosphate isomerase [Cellulomonas triticagri]RMI09538.1 carbohydrate kinase [Cellulomonas triticagri]